ncbi:hypothetical protein T01_3208 [Trichinella spiralis]|uniref:Uncharacterized protein n=1 Tax=Trichinella spiralis TaxID=6334 RepID=A0A0V1BRN0_TRISP|nr:hypothetical protein T01_3208 [Trichinella spiralis]
MNRWTETVDIANNHGVRENEINRKGLYLQIIHKDRKKEKESVRKSIKKCHMNVMNWTQQNEAIPADNA